MSGHFCRANLAFEGSPGRAAAGISKASDFDYFGRYLRALNHVGSSQLITTFSLIFVGLHLADLGWVATAMCWIGLDLTGLGWYVLDWAGFGWVGLGWSLLGWKFK